MRYEGWEIKNAVAKYNTQNSRALPEPGRGQCPICKHKNCFGKVSRGSMKWACFSTAHPAESGRKAASFHWGDFLDLDLALQYGKVTQAARMKRLKELGFFSNGGQFRLSQINHGPIGGIKERRDRLLVLLKAPLEATLRSLEQREDALAVAFESIIERAAIFEFDAGMTRSDAVNLALNDHLASL